MKKLILLIYLSGAVFSLAAQPAPEGRRVKISVVNKKEKPVKSNAVFVYHLGQKEAVRPDKTGTVIFNDIIPGDTISVIFGSSLYNIPADGVDSVKFTVDRDRLEAYDQKAGKPIYLGYVKTITKDQILPVTNVDVSRIGAYTNFVEYLSGKVPGLTISHENGVYTAYSRGITTLHGDHSMLVVVDGMEMSSLDAANNVINPNDIHSVTILKDGSMYGNRGAKGVIVVTLKSGERR